MERERVHGRAQLRERGGLDQLQWLGAGRVHVEAGALQRAPHVRERD